MKAEVFYHKIVAIAAQSPAERRLSLVGLHTDVITPYLNAVRAMTAQDAARVSSDGRTLGQVVGHIAEWERFTILDVYSRYVVGWMIADCESEELAQELIR